ncbi:MAG: LEA type 2 family protein [Bacteroidales bacterium]|jgi:LEA14-like dessication related protein|nr:LEA type 2 family protein [Bacteroidales bacterium]MCI1733090.1 LEA type 2 family protein [Bacteroidales bacterium]
MKKLLKIVFCVAAIALIVSGCADYRKIVLEDISITGFKLKSATCAQINLAAYVDNPTGGTFNVTDIDGLLYKDGVKFAHYNLVDPVAIQPRLKTRIPLTIEINLDDPLSVLAMGLNVKSWNKKDFMMDVHAIVRKGGLRIPFVRKNVPLDKVLERVKVRSN